LGPADNDSLRTVVESAIELTSADSAAIFVIPLDSTELELAAAAGIEGPPLDRLAAAVRNPEHPIARTAADASASFDVTPTAPGGPALRSHLPLLAASAGMPVVVGVLAVAHEASLDAEARRTLGELAARAAALVRPD
jgi:GAF domain-containing protein